MNGAQASATQALGITKLDFKFDSTKLGTDQITITGFLNSSSASLSKTIAIYIGGIARSFKLTSGKSPKSSTDSFTLVSKSGKLQFTGKFTKGSRAAQKLRFE